MLLFLVVSLMPLWCSDFCLMTYAGRLLKMVSLAGSVRVRALALALSLTLVCTPDALADETLAFIVQDPHYRTNIGINNLDSFPAEVLLLLYDNGGELIAQGSVQIPSLGFLNLSNVVSFLSGCAYEPAFEGFIRLRSANRISAFAAQILTETSDPGIIPSVREGASHFLLPITTSINPWRSALAIVNLAARPTVVRMTLRDQSGSLLARVERTLEPNSQWIRPDIHEELGIGAVRGHIEVQSLDGASLAVLCRHNQLDSRQNVFQQPFDLLKTARVFYLPYWFAEGLHRNWVVLNNPGSLPAAVTLQAFSPHGISLAEYSTQVPAFGAVLLPDSELFSGKGGMASYGLIRGVSNLPLGGLVIQTDLSTGDTIHTNLVRELSPELLVPSVTQVSPFSSNLLLSNLGEFASWIEIVHRSADGRSTPARSKAWLPARGTVYLEKVLPDLGIPAGYGPLQIRSLEGQPLAAFSHVSSPDNGVRGALNLLDTRPVTSKRIGERLTLQWQYNPAEIPKILEYRIYQGYRAFRNYQRIASVPAVELEYRMDATEAGDFVLMIKAFNGMQESNPSNEVILQVKP